MSNESNYWSAKPFISYDGPDENQHRAEVKVSTGYGEIIELNDSDSGKAMQVKINNGHPKWNSSGWLPKNDPIAPVVQKAFEDGTPIYFRIETKRKPKIDRYKGIEELSKEDANGNTGKAFVGVRLNEGDAWQLSTMALTRLDEDPKAPGQAVSANDYSYEELHKNSSTSTASATPRGGAVDTPWFVKFPDGEMNPGSQAAGVPLNIYSFVLDYFKDNKSLKEGELTKSEEAAQDKSILIATKTILDVCNEIQVTIYGGKINSPDLGAASHTAARKIIFMLLKKSLPLTPEMLNDDERIKEWRDKITDKAVKMWRWSMKEVEGTLTD